MIPVLALLLACGAPDAPDAPATPRTWVQWTAPRPASEHRLLTLAATVEPLPDAQIAVGPRVQARIERWLVEPGVVVAAGAPLAVIDSPQLRGLQGTVAGQRRAREAREAQLGAGTATLAELAEAEATLAGNAASLASARELLREHDGATLWSSPRAGVVASIDCAQEVEVGPDDPCITLVDPRRVAVVAHVPERHLPRLIDLHARWHGADGRVFDDLPLRARDPVAHPTSRTVAHRFTPPDDAALVPGAAGRLDLHVAVDGAWRLPADALTRLDGQDVVFVRDGDASRSLVVEVLGRGAETSEVVVRGALEADSEVAWRGVFQLKSALLLEDE